MVTKEETVTFKKSLEQKKKIDAVSVEDLYLDEVDLKRKAEELKKVVEAKRLEEVERAAKAEEAKKEKEARKVERARKAEENKIAKEAERIRKLEEARKTKEEKKARKVAEAIKAKKEAEKEKLKDELHNLLKENSKRINAASKQVKEKKVVKSKPKIKPIILPEEPLLDDSKMSLDEKIMTVGKRKQPEKRVVMGHPLKIDLNEFLNIENIKSTLENAALEYYGDNSLVSELNVFSDTNSILESKKEKAVKLWNNTEMRWRDFLRDAGKAFELPSSKKVILDNLKKMIAPIVVEEELVAEEPAIQEVVEEEKSVEDLAQVTVAEVGVLLENSLFVNNLTDLLINPEDFQLEARYKLQYDIYKKFGLLDQNNMIVGIDRVKYPFPSYENVLSVFNEFVKDNGVDALMEKMGNGFSVLHIVPIGMPVSKLLQLYGEACNRYSRENGIKRTGADFSANGSLSKEGDEVELHKADWSGTKEEQTAVFVDGAYFGHGMLDIDEEGDMLYGSSNKEDEDIAVSKDCLLAEDSLTPGFEVVLTESKPNLDNDLDRSGGSKSMFSFMKSKKSVSVNDIKAYLDECPLELEKGLNVETWIINALYYLEVYGQIVDDSYGEGMKCVLTDNYLSEVNQYPLMFWKKNKVYLRTVSANEKADDMAVRRMIRLS